MSDVAPLRSRLEAARARLAAARRSAGDRVATAALEIDQDLDALRRTYPSRIQMSLAFDPEIDPFSPPFWAMGIWHDGDYTYVHLLGDAPRFYDEVEGLQTPSKQLDPYLHRLDGVVRYGSVIVALEDGGGDRQLYWYRRPETEGP